MPIIDLKTKEETFAGYVLQAGLYCYVGDGDGYHYAIVWDEEKQSLCYIPTDSYYSDLNLCAIVDATDEVKQKYQAYQLQLKKEAEYKLKKMRVEEKLRDRKRWIAACEYIGLPYSVVKKKLKGNNDILRLLETKVRSDFKKSLKEQVITWLHDPAPKYSFPLSQKQLSYLAPTNYYSGRRYC